MTGSWRIEINGKRITDQSMDYGDCIFRLSQDGHMEGISVPLAIDRLIGRLHTGDVLSLICELEE
jgi:hypothetical protein